MSDIDFLFTAFSPITNNDGFRKISIYSFLLLELRKIRYVKQKIAAIIAEDWGAPVGPPSPLQ